MEEISELKQQLQRTKSELSILYEISNAMRTTLKLEEILYIILTGVTAHTGLGFNRAMLFLVNEKMNLIEGKMGIGPNTGEEAKHIWKQIEEQRMDLDDLVNMFKVSAYPLESQFNQQVKAMKLPLNEKNNLLSLAVLEGMPLHLNPQTIVNYPNDPLLKVLKTQEAAIVPLKAKDKVNGVIIADNIFTKRPISQDDLRMLIMLANQAGLAIENSHLYEQAITRGHVDSLTGLWNHGYFHHLLQSEIEKAKINKSPLSLVMLDMDYFKIYNDNLGHQAGDKVLKELANLLSDCSRKMDWVARYGGEEFSIILPGTIKREAVIIAERLRQIISQHPFDREEILPAKKLTCSLGIATFPEDAKTSSELIGVSDERLYIAKSKGKNIACWS
ncbi:MAG: sensor domain-containing diguanylate cyclase [Candidatus Omnitrophica bacterium]|nr:sensor domain-containing diguanylate cyclase [Candidatus Omnitrophota bacterium]MBU1871885.1 sensor domain-containing diguanylate cyclase [Candidatus Omnitrophota bacterium]